MDRKVQYSFAFAMLILLAVGAISYRAIMLSRESEAWVQHTHEVLRNLQNALLASEKIESTSRGFALTGDESVLDSFPADVLLVQQSLAAVRRLTADNPLQQQRLPTLTHTITSHVASTQKLIDQRRLTGPKLSEATTLGENRQTMNELRQLVGAMEGEELDLLKQRSEDAGKQMVQTQRALILGALLGLGITGTAAWRLHRENVRRLLAEDALRASEARSRALFDAAPDPVVVTDQAGLFVQLNIQTEKQFGYKRDELVGQSVQQILPNGFFQQLNSDVQAEKAEDSTSNNVFELCGQRKDGGRFPVEITLSPLQTSGGLLIIVALRDITERRRSEEQLARTMTELRRSNVDLQQYAYVVSHDLQEPLRMVASFTQLLAERYQGRLDSDADEFIAHAVDGCKRMKRLMLDLLAYARIGKSGEALSWVDAEGALQEAIRNLQRIVEENGAVITHDVLPRVNTDRAQLVQVFQSLVENAIKYRGTGAPRVHVSAASRGPECVFAVQDNGVGIESQYFEKIFVLFQRLHRQPQIDGTGIGLTICKKILEQAGGSIWVESKYGSGSTFYFALPARIVA